MENIQPVSAVGAVDNSANAGNANGLTLEQVAAQMAALTSSVNEITSKLNLSSNAVKGTSLNNDQTLSTEVTGAYDVYENKRLIDAHNHRMLIQAEHAQALAVERAHMVALRSIDHFSSLPPVASKVSGC